MSAGVRCAPPIPVTCCATIWPSRRSTGRRRATWTGWLNCSTSCVGPMRTSRAGRHSLPGGPIGPATRPAARCCRAAPEPAGQAPQSLGCEGLAGLLVAFLGLLFLHRLGRFLLLGLFLVHALCHVGLRITSLSGRADGCAPPPPVCSFASGPTCR